MLIKMNALRFRGRVGETVQIVAQSTGNGGVELADFEYDGTTPPSSPFGTSPGCEITVLPTNRQFQAIVHFNAGAQARYDLFQVDENGALEALDQSVESDAPDPLLAFTITGMAAAMKAAKPPTTKVTKAAKTAKKAARKTATKTARKKTVRKATKKTTRKTIRKTARKAAKKTKKVAKP